MNIRRMNLLLMSGGVTPPVNLDDLPNQVLIWDLQDTDSLTITGGKVQTITDKSGHGNSYNQATSGNRCSYVTGGQNGKSYMRLDAGKVGYQPAVTLGNSPLTIYSVIKLPSILGDGVSELTYRFGSGIQAMYGLDSAGAQAGYRLYIGADGINFSEPTAVPMRTDLMLLKFQFIDNKTIHIEVNDEPIGKVAIAGGGSAINAFGDNFGIYNVTNTQLYEARIFSQQIDSQSATDLIIKNALISEYALTRASGKKNVILAGDSHTAGVMSGIGNVLGPYQYRMVKDGSSATYTIVNEGFSGTVIDPGSSGQGGGNNFSDRYTLYNKSKWHDFNLVINYGTNDAAVRGGAGIPTSAQWKTNFQAYVQTFIDAGWPLNKIIIVTLPYNSGAYPNGNLVNIYNDTISVQVAKGVTLCDWYAAMVTAGQDINTVVGGDGIHGNDAIHTTLLNTLTPLLQA